MSAKPLLYSFRRCPYAMRARLALLASGQVCDHREVLLKDKPSAMLEASPKGTVPVLVLSDGQVIDESLDVAFWALKQSDPHSWLSPWSNGSEDADGLIEWNDGEFKHHLDRYKYASRYEDADAEVHYAEGAKFLSDLNKRLEANAYLDGDEFTFLDAAIAPFVRQFRIADPDRFDDGPWQWVTSWVKAFMERPDFKIIMHKYPVWVPGEPNETFPVEKAA